MEWWWADRSSADPFGVGVTAFCFSLRNLLHRRYNRIRRPIWHHVQLFEHRPRFDGHSEAVGQNGRCWKTSCWFFVKKMDLRAELVLKKRPSRRKREGDVMNCVRAESLEFISGRSVMHRSDRPLRGPDERETHTYTLEGPIKDAGLVGISKR